MAVTVPPKRIFVIGPMNTEKSDENGLLLSEHIPNIAKAARRVLKRLQAERAGFPEWQVITPPHNTGPIPRDVFSHILHCDLAIADMTDWSPNVFYEIALLHANGIPVILLGEPPFYLKQYKYLPVTDFSVENLEEVLADGSFKELEEDDVAVPGLLEDTLTAGPTRMFANPFSEHFGGVHLINVAAATGVATTYYHNFISWTLRGGGVFMDRPEFEGLIVIRPSRIIQAEDTNRLLTERFGQEKPSEDAPPVYELPSFVHVHKGHDRKLFLKYSGKYLIDYPLPIESLRVSSQYRQIAEYVRHNGGENGELDDAYLRPFEERLIQVFFDTLRNLVNDPASPCDPGRLRILPLEEALNVIGGT